MNQNVSYDFTKLPLLRLCMFVISVSIYHLSLRVAPSINGPYFTQQQQPMVYFLDHTQLELYVRFNSV